MIGNKEILLSSRKEAIIVLLVTIVYIIIWFLSLLVPKNIYGFFLPLWFEISCVYLPIIFIITIFILSKIIFKSVDFSDRSLYIEDHDE